MKDKIAIVYDSSGLYTNLALRLAKDFKKVFYYHSWVADYPTPNHTDLGKGFDTIEHTLHPFDHFDDIDLWIFPAIYSGDFQEFLVRQGKLVWGSREGEAMEINRWEFLEYQKKIGMNVSPSVTVQGITALRKELYNGKEGRFVKIDANNRGSAETFKYINDEICEINDIRPLEHNLGMKAELMNFIIQDPIEAKCETGYDGFTVDGQFPATTLLGIEVKDMGYIGGVRPYKDLPKSVIETNEQLAPALKAYGYRGQYHTEVREGTDNKNYLIDITARCGYPPTNALLCIWENIAECMYEGAKGNLVDMKFNGKFVCEIELFSDSAKTDYYTLFMPKELEEWVLRPYITFMEGRTWSIPQDIPNDNVGSLIAIGDTLEQAIDLAKERASQITGHHLKINFECLGDAINEFNKL